MWCPCPRRVAASAGLIWFLCVPAPSAAQAKDAFVRALIDLSQAVAGTTGQEGPAVRSSLDAMATGLAQWDAAVARVEAGFTGAITGAGPAEAARMRATLAATFLERGRVTAATAHLDRAAALDPSFMAGHLLRGLGHARQGHAGDAASAYAAARTLDPAAPAVAYLYLAATRGNAARPERRAALDALVQAVSGGHPATDFTVLQLDLLDDASVEAPLFVPAAYVDGFRLLADAKYPEGLASLRAAAAADPLVTGAARAGAALTPADERARIATADRLVAAGDRDAARASLLDTVRRFPASGLAHWRLGRLSEEGGSQPAALRAYEAAARAAPLAGASVVYAAIGRLHHTSLDLEAAARAYERRAALTPRSARAHLDLGSIYQAQDRLDDALAEYLAAALVDPASAAAFAAAGQLRADQGHDESAIVLLQAAVRLDPNHGTARYALGRALLRAGRSDEARQELAAFERIQKAEMDAQRRQFEENSRAIESALEGGAGKGGQ
jgi:tetratricopeptide (TPR) repeat protein